MDIRTLLKRWLPALVAAALAWAALAPASAAEEFLDPDKAFKVSARPGGDKLVEVTFEVAPGYYLYREQFKFSAPGATLGAVAFPHGKVKYDETFRKDVETYRDVLRIAVPVDQAPREFALYATSQGCADAGLCYPPQQTGFTVSLAGFGGVASVRKLTASDVPIPEVSGASASPDRASGTAAEGTSLGSTLQGGRFWPVVGAFFLAGVLLSLTPCVLPMLPIVSSIIAGHGIEVSRGRGFTLAAAYSLGMAIVYTGLGVAAGLAGEGLAAALQTPWVLAAFGIGLVALALSMFGVYELRLPAAFTSQMTTASQRLPAGRLAGVCAMGGLSALIVSPCVAAPLAGALVYLSQTRDVWLGGTALFSLAAGMSVPLLLVGASAGALLPKAGPWMNEVKTFFGLLLLGVALWTLQILLPAALVLALWGTLCLAAGVLLMLPMRGRRGIAAVPWRPIVAALFAVIGLLQWVGAASGGRDPLQPLIQLSARLRGAEGPGMPAFTSVHSLDELDAALRSSGRPVMLDFYADWCVSCKEMERFTFSDPAVQAKLGGATLLKADVTRNSADDRALLKRFGLFGPPGTIFFDAQGREIAGTRVIGFQSRGRFLETLHEAGI